jgi:hypothetical protein
VGERDIFIGPLVKEGVSTVLDVDSVSRRGYLLREVLSTFKTGDNFS